MIVVADGGSTKTDWRIIDRNGDRLHRSTNGFNPFFVNAETITAELQQHLATEFPVQRAKKVFFYGAGCYDFVRCAVIEKGLKPVFTDATIHVESDMMAAARATCNSKPGIACILGTGSNSCLFDGEKIIDQIPTLGYLLGDEGSGSHLGKLLIQSYFYRELPKKLAIDFEKKYPHKKQEIIELTNDRQRANVFLASLATFISEHIAEPQMQGLVYRSFSELISRHVKKYEGHFTLPVHFTGSVAFHFKEILHLVLKDQLLRPGKVIQKPIDNLVEYHLAQKQ